MLIFQGVSEVECEEKRAAWGKSDLSEMDCKLEDPLGQQVVMIAIKNTKHFSHNKKDLLFSLSPSPQNNQYLTANQNANQKNNTTFQKKRSKTVSQGT